MPIIHDQAGLDKLTTGFQAAFNAAFRDTPIDWDKLATKVMSSSASEQYDWLGQFPMLREWVGERHIRDVAAHSYTIRNRKFESTVEVPREALDDDQFGTYMPLMAEMGHAATRHPDQLVFQLLKDGAIAKCYDGKPFFAAAHPVRGVKAGASNIDSAGGGKYWYLLDCSRPLKPLLLQERDAYEMQAMNRMEDEGAFMRDAYRYGVRGRCSAGYAFWQQAYASNQALSGANFNAAVESMMAVKGDEGNPLGVRPTVLVCGPSNRAEALSVLKKEYTDGGDSNINFEAADMVVTPWLD